jgi:lysophospholipase L1-like esterase
MIDPPADPAPYPAPDDRPSRRGLLRYALAAGAAAGVVGLPAASMARGDAPRVPLTRPRVATLGDSIIQFAEYAAPGPPARLARRARGAMTWVKTLFPAFDDDTWHDPGDARHRRYMRGSNNGVAGDHTTYLGPDNPGTLRRWAEEVAPARPDLVLLSVGTNDINSFRPAGELEADLATHIDRIARDGRALVLTTIRPRWSGGEFGWRAPDARGDRRYAVRESVNDWIRSRAAPGLQIADVNERLEDPAARGGAGGDWLPDLLPPDGVHPGPRAAWAEALTLLPIMRWLVADGNVYGADHERPGNLLPNGGFAGRSGEVGPGVRGRCATGWSIVRTSGDARVTAYPTVEHGAGTQVLEITPGRHDSTFVLRTSPERLPLRGVGERAWLRFHLCQEVSAYAGWQAYGPRLFLSRRGGRGWTMKAGALETTPGELLPAAAWRGWPATHPVRRSPGDDLAWCSVLIKVAGGVPGLPVLRFSRAQLRRIPDPRVAWRATGPLTRHGAGSPGGTGPRGS